MEYTSNCLLQEAQIELLKNKIQELQDENAALMKQLHPSGTEEYVTTVTKPYKIIKDDYINITEKCNILPKNSKKS